MNKYELIISGKSPNYFIKKLISKKIYFYDLKYIDRKTIKIIVDENSLEEISKIKTSYKYKIINTYGLIKIKRIIKKGSIFIIFFLFGISVNIFLSNIIFDIELIHENDYIKELVNKDLRSFGIKKYSFKPSFSKKEQIVKKILEKEKNDLEWLEIESIGTKYIVHIEQRKLNKKEDICDKQNIVAKKDAMILEIVADAGEVLKKKLDYVKKGEIIISGAIHNKEDVKAIRCAKGTVFGEVWYEVKLELPKKYREEKLTGREKKTLEITFFNKNYSLFNRFSSYKRKKTKLIGSNLFPISVNYTKFFETIVTEKNYDIETVNNEALLMAEDSLKNKLSAKYTILSKKVLKKSVKESKIIVEVFIKVKENITDFANIVEENKEG